MSEKPSMLDINPDFKVKDNGSDAKGNTPTKAENKTGLKFFTNEFKGKSDKDIPKSKQVEEVVPLAEYNKILKDLEKATKDVSSLTATKSRLLTQADKHSETITQQRTQIGELQKLLDKTDLDNPEATSSLVKSLSDYKTKTTNLRKELKERSEYVGQLESKLEELSSSPSNNQELVDELDALKQRYALIEKENTELKEAYEKVVTNFEEKAVIIKQKAQSEIEDKTKMFSVLESNNKQLLVEVEMMGAANIEVNSKLKQATAELEELKLKGENSDELQATIDSLRKELDASNLEKEELAKQLQELTAQMQQEQENIKKHQETVDALTTANETTQQELQASLSEKEKQLASLQELVKAQDETASAIATNESTILALTEENTKLKSEVDILKGELERMSQTAQVNEQDLEKLRTVIQTQQQTIETLTKQVEILTKGNEEMTLRYSQFEPLVDAYGRVLNVIKGADEETYNTFGELFRNEVLTNETLVEAILSVPEK